MSWAEMENLTSGKFCSVSVQLFTADRYEGLISITHEGEHSDLNQSVET